MIIGIVQFEIFVAFSVSLKEKRMVLRSLKSELRTTFNISIIEIDDQDKWQKATLAAATIGNDKANVDATLSHLINFLEQNKRYQLLDYHRELL